MTIEYKIHTGTYRVERSFTGTKQTSELIKQRVKKAAKAQSAGMPFTFPSYQTTKTEKVV